MTKIRTTLLAACLVGLAAAPALAQRSERRSISFEGCLQTIRETSGRLGVTPEVVVQTNILHIARFPTTTGSVLITCSRPDSAMLIEDRPR